MTDNQNTEVARTFASNDVIAWESNARATGALVGELRGQPHLAIAQRQQQASGDDVGGRGGLHLVRGLAQGDVGVAQVHQQEAARLPVQARLGAPGERLVRAVP